MTGLPQNMETLFVNCRTATMANRSLSIIEQAAVAVKSGKITWVGKEKELSNTDAQKAETVINCQNQWILPGFVDCHTHLVWSGSRSNEFEMRLEGATYEEISRQGGGIAATVNATRNASEEDLFKSAKKRIENMIRQGTTTLEIKTGYGLNLETELKMLKVIDRLNRYFPIHIAATFLGAHALPPEYKEDTDGYIGHIIRDMLPEVKKQGIASAVDVFCERIAFSREQTQKVFKAAKNLGFDIKLHAEQLSDNDGAGLAAQMGALSCDHLEYLSVKGARQMADHNVAAVLLPGAFYYLKETQKPPVNLFRDLKIPMAVSTDLNPGSSPVQSLPLIMNMACMMFGLTVEEALVGATTNAAAALKLSDSKGSIEPGKDADLAVWDIDRPADLCYITGMPPATMVMAKGQRIINHL